MIDNKTIRQVVINKALLPCTPGELEYHEAATAAGGYSVSFTTNVEGAVQDFVTVIEPKQSGSGDPSPDNVRPISGTDTLSFLHSIIKTPPSFPTIINVPLGQTVYGGEVECVGGEVTKTDEIIDMGDISWTYSGSVFRGVISDGVILTQANIIDFVCSCYLVKGSGNSGKWTSDNLVCWHGTGSGCYIYVNDTNYNDADVFKTAVTGQKLVYKLATPTTAQITPVTVNTLKGKQKIENSKKFEFSLKYPIMVSGSCEISKQFLPIFYPSGKD